MNACSFCGRRRDEVAKMIAGPAVFICGECVDLCTEIAAEGKQVIPFAASLQRAALKHAVVAAALQWFREVTPRTLHQEVSLWNAAKTLAAFSQAQPSCSQCGRDLVRGPIGGGHFDWLECKHAP